MKIYNRFKKMKTSTKLGLATSAVYAATSFALPVFANQTEKSEVIQPVDVSQLTTVEQADDLYRKKVQEYWVYKDYNTETVKNLRKILVKKKELVEKKDRDLFHEDMDLVRQWSRWNERISHVETMLESLESEQGETVPGEFVNLEGIKTSKEAEALYLKKSEEYLPYDLNDARNLHKILLKQKYLLDREFSHNYQGNIRVYEQEKDLDKEIKALEEKLIFLKAGNDLASGEGINLEHIKTFEEANLLFDKKLAVYCMDKKLDPNEIRILHRILMKEKELLDKAGFVDEAYFQAKKEATILAKKRSKLEKELEHLKEPNEKFFNYISGQRKKLEAELEKEFPGILNKRNSDINISYSSDDEFSRVSDLGKLVQQTAKGIYTEISLTYNDDDSDLDVISDKSSDRLDLMDVAKVLRVISTYESMLGGSQEDFLLRKEILKKEIDVLNLKEGNIWQKALNDREKSEVDAYVKSQSDLTERLRNFSNYIAFKDKADDFLEKFGDRNKYWSWSLMANEVLEKKMGNNYMLLNKSDKRLIENNLNQYLKSLGLEAEVADLKNPTDYKFPVWFCILVNGFTLPIVRNILVKKYVGEASSDDYVLTTVLAVLNGALGVLFLDGLHPLVFPARLATPLVIQPIKKLMYRKGY